MTLDERNAVVDAATAEALWAGCDHIQKALGTNTGNFAGRFFASPESRLKVRMTLQHFMQAEIAEAAALRRERMRDEDDAHDFAARQMGFALTDD